MLSLGLVLLLPLLLLWASGSADLPDHAGPGKLDERTVARDLEPRIRVRLSEIPHRAVIHEVSAVVRSELQIHRPVDPFDLGHERLLERLVEGKPLKLDLEGLTGLAEVDELDVVSLFRYAIGFGEPEVPLAASKGGTPLDGSVDERVRHEVEADDRDVRRLEGQRRRDRLGRKREHGLHRLTDDGGLIVIARASDGIENRLSRIQEAEPIRPTVVIRAAVGILSREVEAVGGVVGWPRAPLVFAVLSHKQSALQGMVARREPNAVGVSVPPRDGLDRVLRIPRVKPRSQDGAVANTVMQRPGERFDGLSAVVGAEERVPARLVPTAGVEQIGAEDDVLT